MNKGEIVGSIYILTNPSFPKYVKIGYANDVEKRIKDLNQSECVPFGFRLYASYDVERRLEDLKIHEMIDRLNPNLRSIDNINGKQRKKEFYAISKEDAYNILETIACISGTEERLHLFENDEPLDKEEADAIDETPYKKADYLANKNPAVIDLYNRLEEEIRKELKDIYDKTTPNYIAFCNKSGRNVFELHLQKSKLMILTKEPKNSELLIGEKIPDSYLWSLNYRFYISTIEEIEKAVQIFKDVNNQFK